MTTRQHNLALPMEQILAFCRKYPIQKLSLFGSVLRDDFGDQSDIDLLVEFSPDAAISYFDVAGMELELGEILGRKVDLRTPQDLNARFRQSVLNSAELIYAAN